MRIATFYLTIGCEKHSTFLNDKTMKIKILSALKTKYSNLGFNAKALDGVAAVLAQTVTDENQIEDAVNGVEGLLRVFQADNDRQRTEYATLKSQHDELLKKSQQGNGGGSDNNATNDDEPAWFKAYKQEQEQRFNAIKSESEALKAAKAKDERNALIATKAKELGIPDWRMKQGFVIADDADEASIGEYLAGVQKDIVAAGLDGKGKFPLAGDSVASKEETDKIVSGMKF